MKEYIEVTVMDEGSVIIEKDTTFEELSKKYSHKFKAPIVLAKANFSIRELGMKILESCHIEFYDLTDEEGMRVYTRGVSFLMIKAAKDVLGKDASIIIEHSINKNYYCEFSSIDVALTKETLSAIQDRMEELADLDIPIEKITLKRNEAIKMSETQKMYDKARLFKYRRSSNINMYKIEDIYDYFYGYMVPSTGYLEKFKLERYENGFMMCFPSAENPDIINDVHHLEKISSIFMEQSRWLSLMKVNNVADLNDLVVDGGMRDLIRINEALHEKKIANIADAIAENKEKIKVILIAGPSSSGKTTFAQRLGVQLRVNGIMPHVIGLDDYFINREDTPRDEFGKHDFENIDALDLKQFNEDLTKLINGEKIERPSYNFVTGKREYLGRFTEIKNDEVIVIEGIHGLNDKLTSSIAEEHKYKIFISAMTQLNVDDHNRISTSDSRLIRRIVRDHQFRGSDAATTIDGWASVRRGETKNIFPYQENADVVFNSATIYEVSVLKQYIEPLLFKIDKTMPEYLTAKRLIKFLDYFLGVSSEHVQDNSIIKEFIGGSIFDC